MQFWTFDEYALFADAMMERPLFFHCFELMYWCGLREGELLALTYRDFNFFQKTVSISKTYREIKGKEIIIPIKTTKDNRIVSMPDHVCEEMMDYFDMCYDEDDTRAFPCSKYSLSEAMTRGTRKAGVKRIWIQDLRHSHISLLISLGFSAAEIAKRVGHESSTIKYRYAHMFLSPQTNLANKLNDLMKDKKDV